MKLSEALDILNKPQAGSASSRELVLACGFTPLHLQTFLAANLREAFPTSLIKIKTGLYGDLAGTLERIKPSAGTELVVVIEWTDLDQRLGIRSLGSWRAKDIPNIVESADRQSKRLTNVMQRLAESVPVYLCTPTLPLPPIFTSPGIQAHQQECALRTIAASLATELSACRLARVLNLQRVDEQSPLDSRFDPKAEIKSGFPYSLRHASILADLIAKMVRSAPPKKGIITDLDHTLWEGILGEIGVEQISWEMSGSGHVHGIYQRFLDSLATAGVLLGVASKNDPELVERAFARTDLLVQRENLFPIEANWGPKSASIRRILNKWNIAAVDVIFIDDSPMEVAEVQSSFPQMECIVFPNDYWSLWELLRRLRDHFGKSVLSADDEIRLRSIRAGAEFRESMEMQGVPADDFLCNADAILSFTLKPNVQDVRALELINKANQFNLNGMRISESEWLTLLQDPNAFVLTASYQDKFGPLGKIAVALGKTVGSTIRIHSWVMSCRAFSRRIEYQCLKFLYEKLQINEIVFDFESTSRNEPIRNMFLELLGEPAIPGCRLEKAAFDVRVPPLFHRVIDSEIS